MHSARYLEVAGQHVFAECWPGERGVVLCIHTAGQSGAQYRHAAPSLARHGFDVIVVDLPGHGRSEPVPGRPVDDLGWYAGWCVEFLAAWGAEPAWLLGCSIGGAIALDIATRPQARVRGVVALNPSGVLGGADGWVPRSPLLEDAGSPSMRERTYLGTVDACGSAVSPSAVETIARMHCREDWHITASDIHGAFGHDIRSSLGAVSCPVYLATGEEDYFVPPQRVRRIAELLPHARFEVLAGIGHYPIEELPDLGALVDRWIRVLEGEGR
ncbi:MAG: alpha/beta hydrolase [Thermoleophilia bacterium]|nr:alpha/beta hydrolase [Thermoleophilia bacterium]